MLKVDRLKKLVISLLFSFTLFMIFSSSFANADSCSGNINCNGLISTYGGTTAYTIYNNVAALRAGCSCTCSGGSCSVCSNIYSSCSLFTSSSGCMPGTGCTWTGSVCSSGVCCVGGQFASSSTSCASQVRFTCTNQVIEIQSSFEYCTGSSATSCGTTWGSWINQGVYQACNPSLNYCTEGQTSSSTFGCTAIPVISPDASTPYVPSEYSTPGSCAFSNTYVNSAGTPTSGVNSVPYVKCVANAPFGCSHFTSSHTCYVHNCVYGSCPGNFPFTPCPTWAASSPKGEAACEADHQGGGTGCDWVAPATCACTAGSAQVYFKDNDNDGLGYGTGHCLCAPDSTYKVTNNNDCNDNSPYVAHSTCGVCNSNQLYWKDSCGNQGATVCKNCAPYICNDGAAACKTGYCGNSYVDSALNEVCDGSNLNGQTCESKGLKSGTLKCSANCQSFDTSSCCQTNYGNGCTSAANNCGQTNSGSYSCTGVCSASKPADQSIGGNCGSCGGKVLCGGSCSIATPGNYGNACTSAANNCGQTNSGTINCAGACTASKPADQSIGGNCGSCGGKVLCGGSCSIATPGNYGQACTGPANACGQKNSGTITCAGTCSATTAPANPANYGNSCTVGVGACQRTGTITCSGSCSVSPGSPTAETCNGIDDNCDGTVDNGLGNINVGSSCSTGFAGVCSAGTRYQYCSGGSWTWSSCSQTTSASAETCNGLDDDCNGVVDNGWATFTGRPKNDNQVGVCAGSKKQCSSGAWTNWYNVANIPNYNAVDTCGDALDNDCNGVTDPVPPCVCNNGDTRQQTCGVGACQRTITQTCSASAWGPTCTPGSPTSEVCDAIDNDCDNVVNNGLANINIGTACSTGLLGVCSAGTKYQYCNSGVSSWTWSTCAQSIASSAEVCDGLDNNCDGSIDNGLTAPSQACTVGVGACQRTGVQYKTCNGASGWSAGYGACSVVPGTPTAETCNGIDDNCNGLVDDNLIKPLNDNQKGVCTGSLKQCSGVSGWTNLYNAVNIPNYVATETSPGNCDGLDNDCDGTIDEGCPCVNGAQQNNTCGVGACQRTVLQTCNAGTWGPACVPGTPTNETCNGIDDNCDGVIDDGLSRGTSCGVGVCQRNVTQTCTLGVWGPLCTPGTPSIETCNALDDDCDGTIDNGFDCGFGTGTTSCVAPYNGVCTFCNLTSCKNASIAGPYCNDGIINGAEKCDNGTLWNGVPCIVPINSSCTYCDAGCNILNLTERCGDGIVQGTEECDNGALNGWNATCSPVCTWQDCALGFVSNAPNCYKNTNGQYICMAGDSSNVTLTFQGPQCSLGTYAQVDFLSADGTCNLTYLSSGMTSQMITALTALLDGPLNTRTLRYVFNGVIPANCIGKTLTNYSASLRTGVPPIGTVRSNLLSGLLTTPIILSQCTINGYIPYSSRIGFVESPTFNVPTKVIEPIITNICVNYQLQNVTAVRPPEIFSSGVVNNQCTYGNGSNIVSFCRSKGYDSGMINTENSSSCVKCYNNGPADSSNGQIYNVKFNVTVSGATTELRYNCSSISDGVCPDDFGAPCGLNPLSGLNKDVDCGNHTFVDCVNTYDKDNHVVGNICTGSSPNKISTPWCMIQRTLTNTSLMHVQCPNGAVVQDATTGCPVCLKPGQQMTYSDKGAYAYVYPSYIRLNNVLEGQNASGNYVACPSTKYVAQDRGSGVQCYTSNFCDEGYRDSTTNNLDSKCNTPLIFNATTNMYTINPNCLIMDNGRYDKYCGLDSWYNNYEVYSNNYTIVVK